MLLSDKYPFLTNYFETSIINSNLTHSILFYGTDIDAQYTLAKEIARLLNCTGDKSDNCQCLNCQWIREGTHPAVLTISKQDNKPDDDTSSTVISVKQSEMIKNSLITSSEFHRVFIFCDKDNDGNVKGLNKFVLQDTVANSLLKVIEEPDENITFIFLTQDKEDLISTIISRSQCFFVPAKERQNYNYELIENVFMNYWEIKRAEAFNISKKLTQIADETSPEELFEQMQNYMLMVLKSNPQMSFLIQDIKSVEVAKKEATVGMKNEIIIDELCLKLIR